MMNKFKPISISLSPNVERDDVELALKLIFQPWKWKRVEAIKRFEEKFKNYLGVKYAFSFNSGRTSLFAILKSLELPKDSDILLQAFTCNAVPNPILWAGLNPVYVDCNKESFNIDIDNLRSKISSKSKALIVQHTFGMPANMDEIIQIANENNLILIEDCAHSLGAEWKDRKIGTFGKAAFFSFSRDKVISCVYGGVAVTNDEKIGESLRQAQAEFGMPNRFWIFQQLLHPIILNFLILPLYKFFDLGKILLVFSQWIHILSKAVHWKEKRGLKPNYFPRRLPNALALMAENQFLKLERFNNHRKKIAEFYHRGLSNTKFVLPQDLPGGRGIFLRFTVCHSKAHQILYEAWHKENMLLGDWYTTPIAPGDTKLDKVKYQLGSCPAAENLSKETLNLPTHINISLQPNPGETVSDAERIINFLKQWK